MTDHSAATVAGTAPAPGAGLEPDAIGAAQDTIIAAYIVGTVAEVLLLGPSVLAVFGSSSTNTWAYVGIGCAVGLIMLVIAVIGIKITARVQVSMAAVEYLILIGLAIAGLVWVLGHHPGSVPVTRGWFSLSGVNGKGDAVAGFLVAVFVYGGWDGTLYVNEEVRHRRVNPGRAAILAVALLTIIYTLSQLGFQGVLSPSELAEADNNGTALVTVAQVLGGGFWAKAMALSIALSVIATRWREFADRGELLMIGPFANALADGAMGIFTTRAAAEEFVRGDPFVLHGVVRNWTIREWNEALVPDKPDK
jgi:amino acid transporter